MKFESIENQEEKNNSRKILIRLKEIRQRQKMGQKLKRCLMVEKL